MVTGDPGNGGGPPPPSEQVHLPGPSYLPVLVAFGTSIALVGVVLSWWLFGIGMAILMPPLVIWIRSTREEIAELPLEH
jgi:hypothetical protein